MRGSFQESLAQTEEDLTAFLDNSDHQDNLPATEQPATTSPGPSGSQFMGLSSAPPINQFNTWAEQMAEHLFDLVPTSFDGSIGSAFADLTKFNHHLHKTSSKSRQAQEMMRGVHKRRASRLETFGEMMGGTPAAKLPTAFARSTNSLIPVPSRVQKSKRPRNDVNLRRCAAANSANKFRGNGRIAGLVERAWSG
ncbi:hypothetical protein MMC25_007401 [Agyrium rufum]|nr:hypothetical protein [Agyrium rufum]